MRATAFVQGFLVALIVLTSCRGEGSAQQLDSDRVSAGAQAATSANDYKVILFMIDGPRHTEAFDDPDHQYISRTWNILRPQGAVITNFRNDGLTLTNPGHTSTITGTWQHVANDGTERPHMPTLFEYYRKARSIPKEETWVISGKSKLDICSYSTHEAYGEAYGATYITGLKHDTVVHDTLLAVLEREQPRLVLACFPTVDISGHSGDWDRYLEAIVRVDSLLESVWNFVQQDPFYRDQTYVIVSNDHGRHDENHGGFRNHGCDCEGCRRIMFLALGPNIKANYTTDNTYDQRDICDTVARILDFPVGYSQGTVIEEIFEEP